MKDKMNINIKSQNMCSFTLVVIASLLVLLVSSSTTVFFPLLDVHAQQQKTGVITTNSTTSSTTTKLPQALVVNDVTMGDTPLPLRSSTINGEPTAEFTSSVPGEGKLAEYYPIVLFNFKAQPVEFEKGDLIMKHLLIGPIKSYDSADIITDEANYWKDIPLNERVALEIDHPGPHYLIASVQFSNRTSGIYSGIMDVNAVGIKPSPGNSIQFQLDGTSAASKVVKIEQSDVVASEMDPAFQEIASRIVCSDLSDNGFEVCENENEEAVLEEDKEDDDNDDKRGDDREKDNDNDNDNRNEDVEVRGSGGKDGKYDINNCRGEQCEDADRETQQEKEGDYCEIDPSYCKDKDDGDDNVEEDLNKTGEENKDTER
jgi:hypothetical protein